MELDDEGFALYIIYGKLIVAKERIENKHPLIQDVKYIRDTLKNIEYFKNEAGILPLGRGKRLIQTSRLNQLEKQFRQQIL